MNRKEKIIVAALLLIVALVSSLLTWVFLVSSRVGGPIPVGVTVTAESALGLYWDEACTNEVSSIDFGSVLPGAEAYVTIWIKNEGSAGVTIVWTSNCSIRTNEKITDEWWFQFTNVPIDNSLILVGDKIPTDYHITVASDCPLDTHSWHITI